MLYSRSSKMFNELYDKNLITHNISTSVEQYDSYFFNEIYSESNDPEAVYDYFVSYINDKKQNGLSFDDFELAKRTLYADNIMMYDSVEDIADALVTNYLEGTELFENSDINIPTVPYAHFGGNRITFPVYGAEYYLNFNEGLSEKQALEKIRYEIWSFREAERRYTEAVELLRSAVELVPKRKRADAELIAGVAEFIRNTVRTAINVKEFYLLKRELLSHHGEKRNETVEKMLEICKTERENALSTIPLVERDSRLGYEPSMEYMCDRAHIEWKLRLLHDVMEKELPSYFEK